MRGRHPAGRFALAILVAVAWAGVRGRRDAMVVWWGYNRRPASASEPGGRNFASLNIGLALCSLACCWPRCALVATGCFGVEIDPCAGGGGVQRRLADHQEIRQTALMQSALLELHIRSTIGGD
jgi:hypothetical protein